MTAQTLYTAAGAATFYETSKIYEATAIYEAAKIYAAAGPPFAEAVSEKDPLAHDDAEEEEAAGEEAVLAEHGIDEHRRMGDGKAGLDAADVRAALRLYLAAGAVLAVPVAALLWAVF